MATRRNDKAKTIEWMGRSVKTIHYMDITEEDRQRIENGWYAKPELDEVLEQMRSLARGGKVMSKVSQYYFNDLMSKVHIEYAKWSMEELLKSKDLVGMILEKIEGSPKTFNPALDEMTLFKKCIQLGGKGYVGYPTQFPLKTVDLVLNKYLPNGGNWYDYSCGWGSRLIGALRNNVNYFGTDPNYILTDRLIDMACAYYTANSIDFYYMDECDPDEMQMVESDTGQHIEIYSTGSEVFQHRLEGEMDLCFSSPPYFNLEDYKIGNQSWKEGMTYTVWKDSYLRPTVMNCYRYLKPGGHFICNIKNYDGYDLEGDVVAMADAIGFKREGNLVLENNNRIICTGNLGDSSEKCFVFVKDFC